MIRVLMRQKYWRKVKILKLRKICLYSALNCIEKCVRLCWLDVNYNNKHSLWLETFSQFLRNFQFCYSLEYKLWCTCKEKEIIFCNETIRNSEKMKAQKISNKSVSGRNKILKLYILWNFSNSLFQTL